MLLGDTAIETGADSNVAGLAEAFKTTASASGSLGSLSVYIPTGSSSTRLVAAIYSDNGGHPSTLLASGSLTAPAPNSWNAVTLTSTPQITLGTAYWIAILSPVGAGTLAFRDARRNGATEMSSQANLSTLPTAWTRGAIYADGPVSAYGVAAAVAPDTSPPSSPTSLTAATVTQTGLTLSWSASSDNVGVAGYDVLRNGVKVGTTSSTGTSWFGLACGTTYTVAVDAFDAAGNTSAPAQISVSTLPCSDTTAPSIPTGLAASTVTQTGLTLSWSASSDNVGVAGYDVLRNGVKVGTTSSTGTSWFGLACGTTYTVAVDAFDAAGNTSAPAQISVSTLPCSDTMSPSPPSGLLQTASTASSVSVAWQASTDNVGVTGYDTFLDGASRGTVTPTSTTLSGLTCGTTYTVAIAARDAAGNRSSQSSVSTATRACDMPPTVTITGPSSSASVSGSVTITANASDDVGVAGVQFKVDGASLGSEDTTAPYSVVWDTTAIADGPHALTATARDSAGATTTSAPVSVTISNSGGAVAPTPVPGANVNGVTVGGGFLEDSARQVLRTAGNVVYVVAADDNTCQNGGSGVIRVEKGVGGQPANAGVPTSFVEQDAANHPVSTGSGSCLFSSATSVLFSPDSRLDRVGTIHMAYLDTASGTVYYQTFSTVTDTWGPRVAIALEWAQELPGSGWPRGGQVALTLDANDVPDVVYATSGGANSLVFKTRAGGLWSAATTVATGTDLMHPSMVTSRDGSLHLAWLENSLAAHSTVRYARFDGSLVDRQRR